MKKSFVIIIAIFVLFVVVLSGCNEQSNDKSSDKNVENKFIGAWKTDLGLNDTGGYHYTWIFYVNKTLRTERSQTGKPEIYPSYYNWEFKDGQLCVNPLGEEDPIYQRCGSIEFSHSDTSFTWTFGDQLIMTFNKFQ